MQKHGENKNALNEVSPNYSFELNNLGVKLYNQYVNTGVFDELQQAIEAFRQAIKKTPLNSSCLPNRLNNLGVGLISYYIHKNIFNNLNEAITTFEQAVEQTTDDLLNLPIYLNNLGSGLCERYFYSRQFEDIQNAIDYFEQAVDKVAFDSPDLPIYLNNMANALRSRSFRGNSLPKTLDRAINAYKQAVEKTDKNSPTFPIYLNNLGSALYERYKYGSNVLFNSEDRQHAINIYERAVRTGISINVGIGLKAAHHWVHWAFFRKNWNEVWQAYKNVREASEWLLQTQLLRDEKETLLKENQGITAEVAYALAKIDNLKDAVIVVEYGLARMLNESLDKERANLEGLKNTHKELYKEYWNIRNEWRQITQQPITKQQTAKGNKILKNISANTKEGTLHSVQLGRSHEDFSKPPIKTENIMEDSEAMRLALRPLHKEWKAILEQIRRVKGYENFLKPPSSEKVFTNLKNIAKDITLVYILSTSDGGLAIIVQKNDITPVWLPDLTEDVLLENFKNDKKVQEYSWSFTDPLSDYVGIPERFRVNPEPGNPLIFITRIFFWILQAINKYTEEENKLNENSKKLQGYFEIYNDQLQGKEKEQAQLKWEQALSDSTHWLWQTIMSPIINQLPPQSKVTLIPVGSLNLLPLHAAWTTDETGKRRYALDELTISYAPNARALQAASTLAQQVKEDKLLAIDNPDNNLETSAKEIEDIQAMFTHSQVLSQQNANHDSVLKALPNYNVLHFSCHGRNDFQQPLQSGLKMNDKPITLEELLNKRLKARLVTLSACETGLPGTALPDEVVSLSTGLLQAGVAGVVASLWSVPEIGTTILMIRFYDLWQQQKILPSEALQQAQQWMHRTDNNDKFKYIKSISKDLSKDSPTRQLLSDIDNSQKEFSEPFHWAAFNYVGV